MARPKCCRRISQTPACRVFKPLGVPVSALEEVVLSIDEVEALRLADLEGLYHEQAAERMNVSRQTFGRIVETARRKVARVLSEGLALRIEGGEIETPENRTFECDECHHTWAVPYGTGRPEGCPECKSQSIHRFEGQGDPLRQGGSCKRKQCRGSRSQKIISSVEEA
jgi:uncharacterized protein